MRLGGGANELFFVSNAGGMYTGAAVVPAADGPRREVNIFFVEEVSTFPNFYENATMITMRMMPEEIVIG